MIFEEKYSSCYISHAILGNMCIIIICSPVSDVINFEINGIVIQIEKAVINNRLRFSKVS